MADRIAREKQLPVDQALGIAISACNALQVATTPASSTGTSSPATSS